MRYREEDLDFILQHEKAPPHGKGRTPDQNLEKHSSLDLTEEVHQKERYSLQLYPHYDLMQSERVPELSSKPGS